MIARRRIISTLGVLAVLGLFTFLLVTKLTVGYSPKAVVPDIVFDRFTLDNGLTVILHEDHTSPWVAINIWYHVGSKDEKADKHGLAHLCEHLMFLGSEHSDEEFSKVVERFDAKNSNGSTDRDRTRFFMDVPKSALSEALWVESDRMGYAVGTLTEKKLERARAEIEKETGTDKRSPHTLAEGILVSKVYPPEHPYSHHPLWSTEGLKSISLSDVKEWFRRNYQPSDAVLVLAGDIDIQAAREEVKKYFAGLKPGNAANREPASVPRPYQRRETLMAPVPSPRIYEVWNVPGYSSSDVDYLDLFRHLLSFRLEDRLIDNQRLATSVSVSLKSFELCGQFQIEITAKTGSDLLGIENIVDEQLEALRSQGPSRKELEDLKAELLSSFNSDLDRIGGQGGKSDILAISEVLAGDPGHYRKAFQRIQAAKPEDVKAIGNRWLSDSSFVLYIMPQ